MKRADSKLSAVGLLKRRPGMHGDGAGLWLQVTKSGARTWVFRFMLAGRAREMGLGPLHTVGLADARESARLARLQLRNGIDPIEQRLERRAAAKAEAARPVRFKECAADLIAAKAAEWRNQKHREQWENTLATYAYPFIGNKVVRTIDTDDVLSVLRPIWTKKTETATRVRQRVEAVLDFATVKRFRTGENPARWRGHLDKILAKPAKVKRVVHQPALPYAQVPEFMADLRQQAGIGARALEFVILTAVRTGEALGAKPGEFDLKAKVWTIPSERMKASKEHSVPLSARAVAILEELLGHGDEWVFPGAKEGKPLSNMALLAVIRRMRGRAFVTHGFRSSFRDWAGETTAFPPEVVEHALAHQLKDKTEKAYQRGTLFAKRVLLMDAWASYCAQADAVDVEVPHGSE